MRIRSTTALLAVSLLAGACVKAPPVDHPDIDVPPPAAWTGADSESAAPLSRWWLTFGDPRLDKLVDVALEQNRDLWVAAARINRAAAQARIAGADLKPSIDIGLEGGRSQQVFTGLPVPGGADVLSATASRVGVSIGIGWEVDLWGRLRAQTRSAIAELQASEADYHAARLSIAAQTARVWFAIAEAEEQVDLAVRSADSFRSLAGHIRSRYEKGVRPALDLRLALSNQEAAEALVEQRRAQLNAAVRQLEVLVGGYPAGDLIDGFDAIFLPDTPPPVPSGLPSELVSRRPDLIASERRVASANQQLLSARRSLYPRFSLTASGGSASTELGDLIDGDFSVWSLFGNLVQPIFQGGRLRAGVELADAVVDETLAFYAGELLDAYAEVEIALSTEAYLSEQERHLAETVRQLIAADRLAETRYRIGVGDYLSLLESQTRAVTAQINLLALRRIRLNNRIDLHVALGGGFDASTIFDDPSQSDETSGGTTDNSGAEKKDKKEEAS